MSFGFELIGENGSLQVTAKHPNYFCVYSAIITERRLNLSSLRVDDVIAFKPQSYPSGLAEDYVQSGSSIRVFGSCRVLIYRRSDFINAPEDDFGINVYKEDGDLSFTSSRRLLLLNGSAITANKVLVYQGSGLISRPVENVWGVLYTGLTLNSSGGAVVQVLGPAPGESISPVNVSFTTTPLFADATGIPVTYTTGDISGV